MDDILAICEAFHKKFQVYPLVTVDGLSSAGGNFVLWKQEVLCDNQPYYNIGSTPSMALWFVEGWKKIPHGAITFSSIDELQGEISRMEKMNGEN